MAANKVFITNKRDFGTVVICAPDRDSAAIMLKGYLSVQNPQDTSVDLADLEEIHYRKATIRRIS